MGWEDHQGGHGASRLSPANAGSKAYLRTEVDTDAAGKTTLSWHFDDGAPAAEAATDGWCALLTNLDPSEAGAAEVLRWW